MNIIHFTSGASDPLTTFGTRAASFLPLFDTQDNSHILPSSRFKREH
jgi:hypothetical protein